MYIYDLKKYAWVDKQHTKTAQDQPPCGAIPPPLAEQCATGAWPPAPQEPASKYWVIGQVKEIQDT